MRGAAFGYGRAPVLRDVDLEVRAGDLLGVAGPNGAGKTTLLLGLAGLLRPTAGTVERATAAIGYVPQRETLDAAFPLSVEDVVLLGACGRLRGLRRLGRDERAAAAGALARVDLIAHRRALFSALSGGQRQRVLIARALVERPRLLVLDEPTAGVDLATTRLVLRLLRDVAGAGAAVVLVSHEHDLLRAATREVLWVDGGRVARGAATELLSSEALARRLGGLAEDA